MPVGVMLNSMSEDEYQNWFLYIQKHETSTVNEIQMAVLTNIAMSFAGSKKKTTYRDFLIRGQGKTQKKTPISSDAIKAVFQSIVI